MRKNTKDDFWKKVDKSGDCWLEYEMNNGMWVDVDYFADQHDRKLIELDSVTWRGVGIMHVLTRDEMDELFSACYENELDLAVCAAEDRADAMRDGS